MNVALVKKSKVYMYVIFFTVSVHKNQFRFECRPIRKPYFEIGIDFYIKKVPFKLGNYLVI